MGVILQILCLGLFCVGLAGAALADKRVALVIGNADYTNVPALTNPISDAGAIGASLERIGFTVTRQNDLGYDAMRRALLDFSRVAAGADMALIYYAGHGMEVGGQNYLVPTDARLARDLDVPYEAIPLDLALNALDGVRGTRLILLDACRDNPFAAAMKTSGGSRSIGRGLARIEPSVGTLVAYAAKGGTTADDGSGKHSPFAEALLEHMEEPGVDIQFLFRQVRDTVLQETNGRQEPFVYGSLPGKAVYLRPAKEAPAPVATPTPQVQASAPSGNEELAADVAFWNSIKDSRDHRLFETYLQQFPNGRFADLARIFVARLDATTPGTAPAPVPAAPITSEPAAAGPDAPGPVASLPPAEPTPELIRDIQNELDRVGCDPGAADGVWGRRSRGAVDDFARYAKLSLDTNEPSEALLNAVKQEKGRVCPLVCGARYEPKGGHCVLKTCSNGLILSSKGACVRPQASARPAAPAARTSSGASGGHCRRETSAQCISRLSTPHSDQFAIQAQCTNPSRLLEICN